MHLTDRLQRGRLEASSILSQISELLIAAHASSTAPHLIHIASLTTAANANAQEILIALDWEVFGVLRRAGFNCTVCPVGEERPEMC